MPRKTARLLFSAFALASVLGVTPPPAAAQAPASSTPSSNNEGWRTEIFPLYGWLPIFMSTVDVPDRPGLPGSGVSSDTSSSLNGAYAGAFRLERKRWSLAGEYLWAGLSASKTQPLFHLGTHMSYGEMRIGREILPALYIDGGVRYVGLVVDVTVSDFPTSTWRPGTWEGVVGLTFRPQISKRTRIISSAAFGGIGVSDHRSGTGDILFEWKVATHCSIGGGYNVLYLHRNGTLFDKPVYYRQTLHGPLMALGIPF
jgi:hypothetical protein